MMKALARQLDDTDSLVEIERRDLRTLIRSLRLPRFIARLASMTRRSIGPNRESSLFREPIRDWLSFSPSNITAALDTTTQ